MSEENVEIVRRQNDAFNRGDLAQVFELTDPVELHAYHTLDEALRAAGLV